ncbi:MAG: methylenetetrahydrofolate reductase C-terminal domain-containing protein [Planctomycetaceae bacterium]|jgi:methylenetetrahydrofolate reductase (NADPH)|nr:methylenetetrahydrofolate reductase C-terminal domain-containing protein [Planctomycetaceae bacterium]
MRPTFYETIRGSVLPERLFPVGAEVVTTRGISTRGISVRGEGSPVVLARELLSDNRISWVSVTDNPGGNPMLPADWLAGQLNDSASQIVLHLACKDYNRAGLESNLWRYAAEGFDHILALSGDLPVTGYPQLAAGVFDIDSVELLAMMSTMNRGLCVPSRRVGVTETLAPTRFYAGCVVNPFKKNENELVPQYYKLVRKIRAGAVWVLPQLGYDMRKFNEVKQFLRLQELDVPVIGNVYVLTKTVAKMFNTGKLAGCVVSDCLLAEVERYAAGHDKGKQYFRELAAKQLAVFRGLGFAAGYLGGLAKPEAFFEIIELANQYSRDDWKQFYYEIQFSQPNEFYFFDKDFCDADFLPNANLPDANLSNANLPDANLPNANLPESKLPQPNPVLRKLKRTKNITLFYRFSRLVHAVAFHRGNGLYPIFRRIFQILDKNKLSYCLRMLHWIEKEAKHTLYGCTDCGDCGLPDTAYLCPMNSCSKNMRNGPCGGSAKSRCEADDKDCIWTIAYDRLKYFGELDDFLNSPVLNYNAALKGTSAWSNLYLDRDHSAAQQLSPSPNEPPTSASTTTTTENASAT